MRRVLWWLIGGLRGGRNHLRIIRALDGMPMNASQFLNELDLDYRITQYHLELLIENNVLMIMGDNYGRTHFLTDQMEANLDVLDEVARKADLDDVTVGGDDA